LAEGRKQKEGEENRGRNEKWTMEKKINMDGQDEKDFNHGLHG
jgi:hypothetical protein